MLAIQIFNERSERKQFCEILSVSKYRLFSRYAGLGGAAGMKIPNPIQKVRSHISGVGAIAENASTAPRVHERARSDGRP